jgi:Icc-related predicted phosphoesterase
MRIRIASDIHGAYDELANLLHSDDTAILLGDYVNIIDYEDLSGILSEFIDRGTIKKTVDLIQSGDIRAAGKLMKETSSNVDNLFGRISARVDECYAGFFPKLKCRAFIIHGNVDYPEFIPKYTGSNLTYIRDQKSVVMGGRKLGFVSGHPKMTYSFGMPGEVKPEEFQKRLAALGPVDHLFVHPPPAIEDLAWDTAAFRNEGGSEALVDYVREHQPATVHFGHVHKPRKREACIGRTRMINVGCFRDEKKITTLEVG